jgi:hypothetical protein
MTHVGTSVVAEIAHQPGPFRQVEECLFDFFVGRSMPKRLGASPEEPETLGNRTLAPHLLREVGRDLGYHVDLDLRLNNASP